MDKKTFKIPTVDDMDESRSDYGGEMSSFSKLKKLESGHFRGTKNRENSTVSEEESISTADSGTIIDSEKYERKIPMPTPEPIIGNKAQDIAGTSLSAGPSSTARAVIVNGRQKGNSVLKFLRNVPWEWGETTADYVMGTACCALFLSVKFHKLHPEYIHERFKKVGKSYALQILFLQTDGEEMDNSLRELNRMSFMAGWTLILTWSAEETAEYIESFKIYENKPCEFLMAKKEANHRLLIIDVLTAISSVNRSDAENLIDAFGSLKSMTEARLEDLALCQGIGLKKAQRLYEAFSRPFTGSYVDPQPVESTANKQNEDIIEIFPDEDDL